MQAKKLASNVSPARSRLMARVRQRDTSAELAVRRVVWNCGFRFRTGAKDLPGRPDLVNRTQRWAIFVNGCFWHAHEACPRAGIPKNNRPFWRKKFRENKARDERNLQLLRERGFSVLVVWESEIEDTKSLNKKVRSFLLHLPSMGQDRVAKGRASEGTAPRERYESTKNGREVARTVLLSAGGSVTTAIRPATVNSSEDPHAAFDHAFLRLRASLPEPPTGKLVRAADLFCGCGGLSLGAREAATAVGQRLEVAWAVDSDPWCVQVYGDNFGAGAAKQADIVKVLDGALGAKPTRSERLLVGQLGKIDILLASPPCQGHSNLNNHSRRQDARNALYEKVARFVEIVRPEHVLVENVPGVVLAKEKAFERTLRLLRQLKYEVDSGVVDLRDLGVPQRRRRHVLVASRRQSISVADTIRRHAAAGVRSVA
jgi:DNA mismatch endonuclease Vsr